MNFHLELLKSGYRKELKRRTGRGPHAASGTTPPWAAYPSAVPRGSISAGRTTWRMQSTSWPEPIQAKYCPETGF